MSLDLNVWKRGSQRAPHKPLLLLYALGRWSCGVKEFDWHSVNESVGALIDQFGGNARPDASNPFVRLRNDYNSKLWVIEGDAQLKLKIPFDKIDENVLVVEDMQPYRTRKVRILNGAHTTMVPFSLCTRRIQIHSFINLLPLCIILLI